MTPHQIVALAVRLFVIWMFCYLVRAFPATHAYFQQYSIPSFSLMLGLGLVLIILILLWKFPIFVASKLLSNQVVQAPKSATYESWFEVGVSLIGVWLIADAMPQLIQYITLKFLLAHSSDVVVGTPEKWTAILVADVAQILLAFILLLSSGSIEKLIKKFRGR